MAVVFSFDLSWLSPLLIFGGVVAYISREKTTTGRLGRVAIGLGLILLSLQLIVTATRPLTESPAVRALLAALPNEVMLDILVGALLTVLSYSSLAIVLLTATLAGLGPGAADRRAGAGARREPRQRAAGGDRDRQGTGVRASTADSATCCSRPSVRCARFRCCRMHWAGSSGSHRRGAPAGGVVPPRLQYRTGAGVHRPDRRGRRAADDAGCRSPRLRRRSAAAAPGPFGAGDAVAGDQLRRARGAAPGRRGGDDAARHRAGAARPTTWAWPTQLRQMDDQVDALYTAIKLYLTQISRESLSERESRRWTDVVSFTINMEQIGDIIERVLQDIEDKKIRPNRRLSDAGTGRGLPPARAAGGQPAAGDERVPRRPCARRAQAARGEGALSRPRSSNTPRPTSRDCATTRRRASRPVRCTWT